MKPTEAGQQTPTCIVCGVVVECCAFCDRVVCVETTCSRCLRIQFRESSPHLHAQGGEEDRMGLEPEATNTLRIMVDESMTADRFGNTGVRVLATPMLVSYFELAAHQLALPTLEPGQGTVGSHIDYRRPSPGGHSDRHAGRLPGDPHRP
jgi:hypothetical protein